MFSSCVCSCKTLQKGTNNPQNPIIHLDELMLKSIVCSFKDRPICLWREPKSVPLLSTLQVRLRGGLQRRRRGLAHAGEVLREDRTVSDHLQRQPAPHQVRLRLRDARGRILRPLRGLQDRCVPDCASRDVAACIKQQHRIKKKKQPEVEQKPSRCCFLHARLNVMNRLVENSQFKFN